MSDISRRVRLDLMTAEERAIFNLVGEIEKLGAHPLLTDVVVLLSEARNKLADWVDLTTNKVANMEGLIEGRIVHVVLPSGPQKGEQRPAIIVKVWPDEYGPGIPGVNVQVFSDSDGPSSNDGLPAVSWHTSLKYDESAKELGSWHWIERTS
jgi:hypothetical protein